MVVTRNVFSHRLTVHRKYDLKVGHLSFLFQADARLIDESDLTGTCPGEVAGSSQAGFTSSTVQFSDLANIIHAL